MGNKQTLSQAELAELSAMTGFSPSDVKRVHRRFVALDTLKRGYVTVSDLQGLPEVGQNPLGDRICKVFAASSPDDEGSRNIVDFKEFLKALATFHKSNVAPNKEEEKLRFLFRVFDSDGDGMLSQAEMRAIIRKIVGGSLDETQLHQIIERVVEDLDPNEDGKIDFYQFAKIFQVQLGGSPTTRFPGQESL